MMWGQIQTKELSRARKLLYGCEAFPVSDDSEGDPPQDLTKESIQKRIIKRFTYAGLSQAEWQKEFRIYATTSIVLFLSIAIAGKFMFLPFAILPIVFFHQRIISRSYKRAENFERDYPAFLLSLASAVRTGLDPIVAFCRSPEIFKGDSELCKEVVKVKENLERGLPEESAFHSFALSVDHPDINLFRTAFILSRKQGSSLSQCLQRLVKVTRQRQSFRRKVASAVAMQKLSAIGIACCACAIGTFQVLSNPQAFLHAFHHPFGQKAIGFGVFLMVSGLFWMMRIARRRI